MNNTTVETLIGAAVIAIAAAFFGYAYVGTESGAAAGGYRLLAEFDNIEGVNPGTDVRLAGIKVGTVSDQSLNLENYQAVVTMTLDPKVQLSDDSTAKVTSEGLLGGKFIALEPGGSEARLKDGDTLTNTQGAIDLWSLISKAMFDRENSQPAPSE